MQLNKLKKQIETELSIKIDFRSDKHLKNNFGLSPIFEYSKANEILKSAINILDIEKRVNLQVELDNLRSCYTLKEELEHLIGLKIKG